MEFKWFKIIMGISQNKNARPNIYYNVKPAQKCANKKGNFLILILENKNSNSAVRAVARVDGGGVLFGNEFAATWRRLLRCQVIKSRKFMKIRGNVFTITGSGPPPYRTIFRLEVNWFAEQFRWENANSNYNRQNCTGAPCQNFWKLTIKVNSVNSLRHRAYYLLFRILRILRVLRNF